MGKEKKAKSKDVAAGEGEQPHSISGSGGMPAHLELQRTRVICGPDINHHTSSTISAAQFQSTGVDSSFKLDHFKRGLSIDVLRYEEDEMEFEVRGISCAMANTLRRIMIAEVPSVAIEHVYIVNNTSIIQDEVLSHRLGLVPLAVDPRLFDFKAVDEAASERNTAVLKLKVECRRLADGTIENEKVYSGQLEWLAGGSEMPEETGAAPFGDAQRQRLPDGVRPVHQDIPLAKLRPGQAIELECHCIKGTGEEHAKWSPVATTWYRLVPEVALLQQPPGELAAELVQELPGLMHAGTGGGIDVDDALRHEKLLEKVRRMSGEPKWAPYLQLRKRKDRFIFTIQSTGAWRPHELFHEAVARITSKCDKVLEGLASFPEPSFVY